MFWSFLSDSIHTPTHLPEAPRHRIRIRRIHRRQKVLHALAQRVPESTEEEENLQEHVMRREGRHPKTSRGEGQGGVAYELAYYYAEDCAGELYEGGEVQPAG